MHNKYVNESSIAKSPSRLIHSTKAQKNLSWTTFYCVPNDTLSQVTFYCAPSDTHFRFAVFFPLWKILQISCFISQKYIDQLIWTSLVPMGGMPYHHKYLEHNFWNIGTLGRFSTKHINSTSCKISNIFSTTIA